jgi:hypothetical protein
MSIHRRLLILPLLLLVIAAACQARQQGPSPAKPETGKATVVGRVMAQSTGRPMVDTVIRLAEVYREEAGKEEGAYVLDGAFSPGAITDAEGYFVMENIEPIDYVLVVGDVFSVYKVVPAASGKPRVWQTKAGEVTDFGVVNIDLSP